MDIIKWKWFKWNVGVLDGVLPPSIDYFTRKGKEFLCGVLSPVFDDTERVWI